MRTPLFPLSLSVFSPGLTLNAARLLTLQLSALAVQLSPLLSQVGAHADGVRGRFKPAGQTTHTGEGGEPPLEPALVGAKPLDSASVIQCY